MHVCPKCGYDDYHHTTVNLSLWGDPGTRIPLVNKMIPNWDVITQEVREFKTLDEGKRFYETLLKVLKETP